MYQIVVVMGQVYLFILPKKKNQMNRLVKIHVPLPYEFSKENKQNYVAKSAYSKRTFICILWYTSWSTHDIGIEGRMLRMCEI